MLYKYILCEYILYKYINMDGKVHQQQHFKYTYTYIYVYMHIYA